MWLKTMFFLVLNAWRTRSLSSTSAYQDFGSLKIDEARVFIFKYIILITICIKDRIALYLFWRFIYVFFYRVHPLPSIFDGIHLILKLCCIFSWQVFMFYDISGLYITYNDKDKVTCYNMVSGMGSFHKGNWEV